MMERVDLLFSIAAAVAVTATLFSSAALLWVSRSRRVDADFTPPVTIFKPLKGVDENLEENLRSFFRLDYPAYQLLFGAVDANDPAVAVAERIIAEFPGRDASLIIGRPGFGLNPKVENVAEMYAYRKYDTILISDSNIRARPTYLRETACYLKDQSVGLVSNPIVGTGETQMGAAMENLQLNGFIAGGVAMAATLGFTCVVGKSMLMPVRALEAVGGLAAVRNLLAEDQILGLKLRKAGYSIRLSHHVIENVNQSRSLKWFLNRHSRWYKLRRRLALPAFLLEPLTNLPALSLAWALTCDTGLGWLGLLPLVALGVARDAFHTRWLRGSFPALRHLPFSLLKDLLLLPIWLNALVNNRVQWRGNQRLIGRFTRLRLTRPSRDALRRARRKRRRLES